MRQRIQVFRDFDKWGFDQKGWASNTRARYFRRAVAAELWLLEHRQTSIVYAKPKDLQAYLFDTKPTARNRNNIRQALIAFGQYLVDRGYSEINAALSLPRLPEPRCLPKPLTVEQAAHVETAARILKLQAITDIYLYAGVRKTEARLLERVHIEDKNLRVFGKGRGGRSKERLIPLHPILRASLTRQLAESQHPRWVFPSPRTSGPISDTWIKTAIREVGIAAHIPGLHPHQLRHTFATRLSEQGVPLEVIQELLGHADPKTTRIYTLVRPERNADAIANLHYRLETSREAGEAVPAGSLPADPGLLRRSLTVANDQ